MAEFDNHLEESSERLGDSLYNAATKKNSGEETVGDGISFNSIKLPPGIVEFLGSKVIKENPGGYYRAVSAEEFEALMLSAGWIQDEMGEWFKRDE